MNKSRPMRFVCLQGEHSYSTTMSCNQTGGGWRRMWGNALRLLAYRLDGRWSLGVEFNSTPTLTRAQEIELVHEGLAAMVRAHCVMCHLQAVEMALREQRPDLMEQQR